jgi:glycyl-tRNA synthetase beta chain
VKTDLFEHGVEKDLYQLFLDVRQDMEKYINGGEYSAALKAMLSMKEPVDAFFDGVMVMAEDENVRQNRLNLLTALGALIRQIGDISKMQES